MKSTISLAYIAFLLSSPMLAEDPTNAATAQMRTGMIELYDDYIRRETILYNQQTNYDVLLGGVAALVVSSLGYYRRGQGPITKVVYSLTQGASIVVIGESMLRLNSTNLSLKIHQDLLSDAQSRTLTANELHHFMVTYTFDQKMAEFKTTGYTALMIASLQFYNAYHERDLDPSIGNVFLFIGANAALYGTYNLWKYMKYNI